VSEPTHGERCLTAAELAEMLGLSMDTILDRWQAGDLDGYRLFGKKGGPVRFRLSAIEAQLERWRQGPGACGPPTEVL
jgi:excisionase family DNA binding protein